MAVKRFRVLKDSALEPKAKAGTIVYNFLGCDYGLAGDDTRLTGLEHRSVTLSEDGRQSSFTIPCRDLEEIKEPPAQDTTELRAKLKALDEASATIAAEAQPLRDEYEAKLKPFTDIEEGIQAEREELLDAHGVEVIGECEGCSTHILSIDRYTVCTDGPYLCLECSPTIAESLPHMQSVLDDGHPLDEVDRQRFVDGIAWAKAEIAAGRGDEKAC